ncbi:MAG: hypothetical protein ACRCVN_06730 [Spirochaetia bacterium]
MKHLAARIFGLLLLLFTYDLFGQTHLSVALDHPVYSLISNLETRGVLTRISQVKPYTRYQIRILLEEASAQKHRLSAREIKIIEKIKAEFETQVEPENNGLGGFLKRGSIDFAGWNSTASIGLHIGAHFRADLGDLSNYYMSAPVNVYVRGDFFGPYVSYNANVILTFDHLRKQPYTHPGLFRPSGMGFHQSLGDDFITNIFTYEGFAFGYDMRPELVGSFYDGRLVFRTGILEDIEIGHGKGGLMLSRHATPFPSFEFNMRPMEWMNFYTVVGSLGDFNTDSHNGQPIQNNKMLSYHNLEFFMNDYIYFSIYESLIWGKRFEFSYLNPFAPYLIGQNLNGDVDNMAIGFSGAFTLPNIGKLWFDFFFDELVLNDFKSPRTEVAVQAGLTIPIPGLPFTSITGQYTKIEPYTYTHYPQSYSFNGLSAGGLQIRTDTGFTNQGRGLGYYLKPNSDEILLRFDTIPMPGMEISLVYSLIRHGTNLKISKWRGNDGKLYNTEAEALVTGGATKVFVFNDLAINGDLGAYLNYGVIGSMARKDFLNDGIYDWTNSFRLWASYDFSYMKPWLPFKISVGYEFAHTFFDFNGRERVTNPDGSVNTVAMFKDEFTGGFKNIFGLYVQIFK